MLHTDNKIIQHKTGLLNLAQELGNVSKACQLMGYSRDTFYRYKAAADEGGVEALFERTRRKPNLANRVDLATEEAVIKCATDFPAYGQARTSNELRKIGVFVSPSGVRSIWLRPNLANFKDRLKALEAKVAQDGIILTETQVQALEKKKLDDEATGEIETEPSRVYRRVQFSKEDPCRTKDTPPVIMRSFVSVLCGCFPSSVVPMPVIMRPISPLAAA